MRMEIQSLFIQHLQKRHKLLQIHGGAPFFPGFHIGRHHSSGVELQRAVHENLQGMDLYVLRIVFPLKALQLFYALFHLPGCRDDITAVDIDRKLPLPIQLAEARINVLMKFRKSGDTGVKDR